MDQLKPGSFWVYRDVIYKVIKIREDLLIQDPTGDWVPTVLYCVPSVRDKTFGRAYTEFLDKFRPYM